MALVLLCTVPTGDPAIVNVRSELIARLYLPEFEGSRALRPGVIHADRPVGEDAARLVYAGDGRNDPQGRPSMFFNPFFFLCESEATANDLYGRWLSIRMDKEHFLRPLLGRSILCDCDRGLGCRLHTLLRVLDRVFPPPRACPMHFGFVDAAVHL